MAVLPINISRITGEFVRHKGRSLSLMLALSAFVSGCDSRQGATEALAERQSWGNTQTAGTISGNATRGRRVAQEKCAACHGADGNSSDPHIPKLAGQSLPYLYWEFRAFKEGVRKSDVMTPTASALAYEDIADVATYFSGLARQPDVVKGDGRIAWGKSLFYSRMPSCAMCHSRPGSQGGPMMGMMGGSMMGGDMGRGMDGGTGGMMGSGTANIPNLEGQHADYIVDQLNRFAAGARQGGVMNRVAASLGETDKRAVAEFLSSNSR